MDEMCPTPGFKFDPSDVQLVMYYLKRKVLGKRLHSDVIREADIYKYAPWDLPVMSGWTNDLKWYFFCPRERKYASGARANRHTDLGYWKMTGKHRTVKNEHKAVGTKKTFVFHKGKAPKGERTDWFMHEYSLEEKELAESGVALNAYVLCAIVKKQEPGPRNDLDCGELCSEDCIFENLEGLDFKPSCSVSIDGDSLASPLFETPPSCSVSIDGDSLASPLFETSLSPCKLLPEVPDTVTLTNDSGLIIREHEDDISAMVSMFSQDSDHFLNVNDLQNGETPGVIQGDEDMGEWVQKSLVNELKIGEELAKQLQIHLNSPSSSRETHRILVQRILYSYEEALSKLNMSSSLGQMEAAKNTPAAEGMPALPTSISRSPQIGVTNHKFEDKEIEKDGLGKKFYYKCIQKGCSAIKGIQRSDEDPMVFDITYCGRHNCSPHKNSPTDLLPRCTPLQSSPIENQESNDAREPQQCQKHHKQDKDTPNSSEEKLRSTFGFLEDMAICYDIMPTNGGFVRETCSLVSNHLVSHSSSHMLEAQPCDANLMIRSSFVSGSSPASHFSGVIEEVVHCRRLDTITKQDLEVDAHTFLGSSISKLPMQYVKKLVNLLYDIYPSRSWARNLRAECLVELNMSCRNDSQIQDLVNLRRVDLSNSNFTRLPDLSWAVKLQGLKLQGCRNLVEVSSIRYLIKLEYLNLDGCTSLSSLPSMRELKLLSLLNLSGCTNLKRLPLSIGCLSSLTNLDLRNCKRIQNLPISTFRLKTLQGFDISGCSNLMKHMSNIWMQEMSSSIDLGSSCPLYSRSDNSNHKENLSNSLCSDGMPAELSKKNQLVHPSLHPEEDDVKPRGQQLEYSPSASISKVLSQEEVSPLDQLISEHLQLFKQEGNNTTSEPDNKASLKRKSSYEMIPTHPITSRPSLRSHNSVLTSGLDLLQQQREGLEEYMSMSVEALHEANGFDDVERILETLIQRSSNLHEISSLEDILHYLGELQENVPDTLVRMHNIQFYKTLLQVKLAHLGVSLVQAEQDYNLLETKFAMLSEEEEKLDAEIQLLMAKKDKLVGEKNSNVSV